jgi:hypothetical protein
MNPRAAGWGGFVVGCIIEPGAVRP